MTRLIVKTIEAAYESNLSRVQTTVLLGRKEVTKVAMTKPSRRTIPEEKTVEKSFSFGEKKPKNAPFSPKNRPFGSQNRL